MAGNAEPETPAAKPGASPGAGAAAFAALGAASRAKADAFLAEQTRLAHEQLRLTELQIENLRDQNAYEVSHLKWRHLNDLMKGVWQILLAAGGVLVAVLIAVVLWKASQAKGLVVETFKAPPSLAAAGITGEAVADDLTSAVGVIRDLADARSLVRSNNVSQEGDDDIRVEIPETGVSISQAWKALRRWLGHERRVHGSLRSAADGTVALTIAVDGERTFTVSGPAGDLAKLEQQAAERVFETVDANNYIVWLINSGRQEDCLAAAARYAQRPGSPAERAETLSLWAGMTRQAGGDLELSIARATAAQRLYPKLVTGHMEAIMSAYGLGHSEYALREARLVQTLRSSDQPPTLRGAPFATVVGLSAFEIALHTGEFDKADIDGCGNCGSAALRQAEMAAHLHDVARGRALIAEGPATGPVLPDELNRARYFTNAVAGDWPAAAVDARAYGAPQPVRMFGPDTTRLASPLLAYALARSGDFAGAEATIGPLPLDCYDCTRTRGQIDALQGRWASADAWFAKAIAVGPSIPFAYADRGEMLLRKGDFDAAIAQLTLANQKGPRFADALELWGEALAAKGQFGPAAAKYEAASRHAPNWGRLHLKWGEALAKQGKADLARAQFQAAVTLTLSAEERAELAAQR